MNEARKKRIALIALLLTGAASATGLALLGARDGINLTISPTQLAEGAVMPGKRVKLHGLVKIGSVRRPGNGMLTTFKITDQFRCVSISFERILPDLFKEGESVVATGQMQADGSVKADEVLAKHDENYMPPEASLAIEEAKRRIAITSKDGKVHGDCAP